MNNRSLHALNMHKKLFTALNESDTETEIPDVYIQVPDHIPSSHFHHNDSCSHMRKNSKKTTTKLQQNCSKCYVCSTRKCRGAGVNR